MIERIQFMLTPVYAFTDWKLQGQTIKNMIINLAKTPSAALAGFNAYVAMSRSWGSSTIQLLQDFDSNCSLCFQTNSYIKKMNTWPWWHVRLFKGTIKATLATSIFSPFNTFLYCTPNICSTIYNSHMLCTIISSHHHLHCLLSLLHFHQINGMWTHQK